MSIDELNILCKQGKFAEAEQACEELLNQYPNDISAARAVAWAYLSLIKHYARQAETNKIIHFINLTQALQLPEREERIFDNLVWNIRVLFDVVASRNLSLSRNILQQIFQPLYAMPINRKNDSYSALLNTALRIKDLPTVLYIIKYWNLSNLRLDDYRKREVGGRQVMSLAEKAFYAQCKGILATENKDIIRHYLPLLQQRCEIYPGFEFLPYFLAKMLIYIGDTEQAIQVLKPFAKKKDSEFWVWQLLGDCHTETDDKMMFYCKAVSCKSPDEMIVKTRLKAGLFFLQNSKPELGKHLLEKAKDTYLQHSWQLPQELRTLTENADYQQIKPSYDSNFVAEQALEAETFLFGELTTRNAMVTFYSKERRMLCFLTEQMEVYKGKLPKTVKSRLHEGAYISITTTPLEPILKANIRHIEVLDNYSNTHFYKSFNGSLRLLPNGAGIVGDVFLPATMLTDCTNGTALKGMAMRSFDKKKGRWSWRAMKIENPHSDEGQNLIPHSDEGQNLIPHSDEGQNLKRNKIL